jgi:hypothetical protein
MDWVCRLGRIGGFVAVAGAAACGKTYVPVPSPDPVPADRTGACVPATAPSGPIAFAIAGPPDSGGGSDLAAVVPSLLSQIAAAATPPVCVSPRPAGPGGTPPDGQDTVVVRRVSDRGTRDALDQGADILVTRDRSVVAYAAGHPALVSVPLPWDRVYVLVMHDQPGGRPDSAADPLRAALASDAVQADARAFGSETVLPDTVCAVDAAHPASVAVVPLAAAGRMPDAARILYDQKDSVARFLAERIAVLASTRSSLLARVAPGLVRMGAEMYAAGLPASEFPRAAMINRGAASIVAIPSLTPTACSDANALLANAPGLPIQSGDRQTATVPLIETRAWAIVRRDAVSRIAALGGRAIVAEDRAP